MYVLMYVHTHTHTHTQTHTYMYTIYKEKSHTHTHTHTLTHTYIHVYKYIKKRVRDTHTHIKQCFIDIYCLPVITPVKSSDAIFAYTHLIATIIKLLSLCVGNSIKYTHICKTENT